MPYKGPGKSSSPTEQPHDQEWSSTVVESPTAYEPSERDLLLSYNGRQKTSDSRLIVYYLVAFLIVPFVGFNLIMHFNNCPLYPSTMDSIRKGWESEVSTHQILQQQWILEQRQHSILEDEWKVKAQWHEKEVERIKRQEEQRQAKVRERWEKETNDHRRAFEESQRREQEQMDTQRRKWQREIDEHDRIAEERRKHEEEERQKLNMFWGDVKAQKCTTYATREYTAVLQNLPATWEHRVEACKVTTLEVHGVSYLPKSCEDKGPGVVLGRWEINGNEPDCATFWNWYKDKASPSGVGNTAYLLSIQGCTSERSGKRRIEHYLEILPQGTDWREFCATTPVDFHGMHFTGAQHCFQENLGTYGHWEIDDNTC
ncbi:hypothetical protein BU15DRAFT_79346 [Melanogaster broomeanus]|nr:hypothetical protein BU15DRAFT_79346 [Melanogaster broomeanus]